MIKLTIKRVSGEVDECIVTPSIEYAFENYAKKGFRKAFLEDEKQTDIYWLAWECLRRKEGSAKPFGADFLDTLESVEVTSADNPNG